MCQCSKRSRAAARGQVIAGYRVTLPDTSVIPPVNKAPFMSAAEARAAIRANNGGSAFTVYANG